MNRHAIPNPADFLQTLDDDLPRIKQCHIGGPRHLTKSSNAHNMNRLPASVSQAKREQQLSLPHAARHLRPLA